MESGVFSLFVLLCPLFPMSSVVSNTSKRGVDCNASPHIPSHQLHTRSIVVGRVGGRVVSRLFQLRLLQPFFTRTAFNNNVYVFVCVCVCVCMNVPFTCRVFFRFLILFNFPLHCIYLIISVLALATHSLPIRCLLYFPCCILKIYHFGLRRY